jgi:hypothetical protein
MRSNKRTYQRKTRKIYRRNHRKGGEHTTSELDRMERGLKDTFAIDIRPSSSSKFATPRSRNSSSFIPPPPLGRPPFSSKSMSGLSFTRETPRRLPRKNSKTYFPYESVIVDPNDIENGVNYDNRELPPKASPLYYKSSTPSAPRIRPMPPTSYELARADSEDRKIPFQRKKLPSNVSVNEYGQVLNQEYNRGARGIGRKTRKTRKYRNKHSKTLHKK